MLLTVKNAVTDPAYRDMTAASSTHSYIAGEHYYLVNFSVFNDIADVLDRRFGGHVRHDIAFIARIGYGPDAPIWLFYVPIAIP
jgi:hypothetical protein